MSGLKILTLGTLLAVVVFAVVLFPAAKSADDAAALTSPSTPAPTKSRSDFGILPAETATAITTSTPTITPTPGPNYAATQIVLDTEQRRIDLANQAIALQNAQVEAEKKAAIAQIEINEANKKAEIAIQAAKDEANADIAANNEIIGNEIKAVSDEIAAKKRKAEIEFWGAVAVIVVLVLAGALAVWFLVLKISAELKMRAFEKETQDMPQEDFSRNVPPTLTPSSGIVVQVNKGSLEVMQHDAPVTQQQRAAIKYGLSHGKTLVFRDFTPRINGFSRDEWDTIRDALIDCERWATIDSAGVLQLTPEGKQFFGIE